MTSQEVVNGKLRQVICTPKAGAGIPILSGNDLSPEFRRLLNKIPSDRVPDFSVPASSAEPAFRMRELLKRMRKDHGWTPHPKDQTTFTYTYTDNAHYEY